MIGEGGGREVEYDIALWKLPSPMPSPPWPCSWPAARLPWEPRGRRRRGLSGRRILQGSGFRQDGFAAEGGNRNSHWVVGSHHMTDTVLSACPALRPKNHWQV